MRAVMERSMDNLDEMWIDTQWDGHKLVVYFSNNDTRWIMVGSTSLGKEIKNLKTHHYIVPLQGTVLVFHREEGERMYNRAECREIWSSLQEMGFWAWGDGSEIGY